MSEWKSIKIMPNMLINSHGHVRRSFDMRPVRLHVSINGYYFFSRCKDGRRVNVYIHQEVAKLFVKGRRKGLQVNHIDGNKLNNDASNLQWVTARQNIEHAVKCGLHRKGKHKSDAEIQEMYSEREKYSQNVLAKRHGMSRTCVNMILNGKRRRWAIEEYHLLHNLEKSSLHATVL